MVLRNTSSGLALGWRLCLAVEAEVAEVPEQGFQSNSSNHLGHWYAEAALAQRRWRRRLPCMQSVEHGGASRPDATLEQNGLWNSLLVLLLVQLLLATTTSHPLMSDPGNCNNKVGHFPDCSDRIVSHITTTCNNKVGFPYCAICLGAADA